MGIDLMVRAGARDEGGEGKLGEEQPDNKRSIWGAETDIF